MTAEETRLWWAEFDENHALNYDKIDRLLYINSPRFRVIEDFDPELARILRGEGLYE